MWKKIIAIVTLICCQQAVTKSPDPTTYPDVVEIPPPTFSIRSLYTGEPIRNNHYGERSERNKHWTLVDIMHKGKPAVQLRVPDGDQCMTATTLLKPCSADYYYLTALNLISTDTGAFLIKAAEFDSCLTSKGFRNYHIERCTRPEILAKPFDLPFLWALVPPFGKSRLLKVPVK